MCFRSGRTSNYSIAGSERGWTLWNQDHHRQLVSSITWSKFLGQPPWVREGSQTEVLSSFQENPQEIQTTSPSPALKSSYKQLMPLWQRWQRPESSVSRFCPLTWPKPNLVKQVNCLLGEEWSRERERGLKLLFHLWRFVRLAQAWCITLILMHVVNFSRIILA